MLPDVSEYILPKIKKTNQVKALMLGSTRFHNTVLPHIIVSKEALNITYSAINETDNNEKINSIPDELAISLSQSGG